MNIAPNVICPYFERCGEVYISCESVIPEASISAHRFSDKRKATEYLRRVCCSYSYGRLCPHAEAANRHYSRLSEEMEV